MAVALPQTSAGSTPGGAVFPLADETLYRVMVVGAEASLRHSIICALTQAMNLACCGECATIAETRQLVGKLAPDLVLLELRLPDGESFDLITWLNQKFPSLPVLVTSDLENPATVTRALAAGASGYLAKRHADGPLIQAIRSVLQGNRYIDAGFEVISPELLMNPSQTPALQKGLCQ